MRGRRYALWGLTTLTLLFWGCGSEPVLFDINKNRGFQPADGGDAENPDAAPTDADGDRSDTLTGEENELESLEGDDPFTPRGPKPGVDRVIVRFRPGSAANQRAALHRRNGLIVDRIIPQLQVHAVRIPPGKSAEEVLARYERHPLVEYAEIEEFVQTAIVPNDPLYDHSLYDHWHLRRIEAPLAWEVTTGDSGVTVAIIDTGVLATHEDLASKLVPGWNVIDGNSNTDDPNGHGTRAAGRAASATNNAKGMASPCWGCRIMPIVAADRFGFSNSTYLAESLTWAADRGARVANMSFGMLHSPTLSGAARYFQESGGVVTMASGNSGIFRDAPSDPYILTVTATDQNDVIPTWSTRGNDTDLSAPGVRVPATSLDGDYSVGNGTSISAPIVAAVAALVYSVNPQLGGEEVQEILKQSADDLGSRGWDPEYGWGRVNAARAVEMALNWSSPPPDDTPPVVAIVDPDDGAEVGGSVIVVADASDDRGVSRVDLYCGEAFISSDAVAPHEWTIDTTALPNGEHAFRAVAVDSAGNTGESEPVVVVVDNAPDTTPPTVAITHPFEGAVLSGTVKVSASATDDTGVTGVELYLDGTFLRSISSEPFEWFVDTTVYTDGEHSFSASAFDSAGNRGDSLPVQVTFDNRTPCDCADPDGDCFDPSCTTDDDDDDDDFLPAVCGNGLCEEGESCQDCPSDCLTGDGALCGNGICEAGNGEDCVACPEDCAGQQGGKPAERFCCGSGGGINPVGCSDPRCTAGGFICTSTVVPDSCCGDGVCNGIETGCKCPVDCGQPEEGEIPGSTCRDGLDNDCNGLIDCEDQDCAGDAYCNTCNGNGLCEPGESCHTCPGDCAGRQTGKPSLRFCCGDGILSPAEEDGSLCDGNP